MKLSKLLEELTRCGVLYGDIDVKLWNRTKSGNYGSDFTVWLDEADPADGDWREIILEAS